MSDETVVVEAPKQETLVEQVQETPQETEARTSGWVTKEEWVESGRAENDWKTAKEFIKDGEFIKTISGLKRENKQTQARLDALQRHHQYVFEKAHQQAIKDLKLERRQAMRAEDLEAVEAIETEMEQLQTQHAQEKQAMLVQAQQSQPQIPPELTQFMERNPWYERDAKLRKRADAIGLVFLQEGGDRQDLLEHVEKEIREMYPDKFGPSKRAAPNAVAAPNRGGRAKADTFELDPMEESIMRGLVDSGEMTKEQYIKDLKKAKGIK